MEVPTNLPTEPRAFATLKMLVAIFFKARNKGKWRPSPTQTTIL